MNVNICPACKQAFTTTAAGLELLYAHSIHEHRLPAEAASDATDEANIEERVEALPQPLPQCR